ncbi:uncharacterized protein LOC124886473 [Capsicum annuum]|uniref:uncharacterized protein LOC124886473 n=1 Tax=Capsicum annuum TaxID=4072 RepID=UPI001FB09DFF|nr:uncharacterized protein LOC124886473 [Capsicum annuum]
MGTPLGDPPPNPLNRSPQFSGGNPLPISANGYHQSYAASLTEPSSSATPNRQEQGMVMARRSVHNGMPAVIFKASDCNGIMATPCKRTIVGRFRCSVSTA